MASFAFPATCKVASFASSTLLITASAGFGAYYAASQGVEHGPILGFLFVLMALGLELAKPFAISAAIEALKSWRVVQAALLTILALVAVTYSLTAELSLMATARGDQVAKRSAEIEVAARTSNRYQRAEAELSEMRPTAKLQALINAAMAGPKLKGCVAPAVRRRVGSALRLWSGESSSNGVLIWKRRWLRPISSGALHPELPILQHLQLRRTLQSSA